MSQRYTIRHGDQTTAEGTVIAHRADTLNGRAIAYEGDPVVCPACGTTGFIVCVGERLLSRDANGRQEALSDDYCMCECEEMPLLIASQSHSMSG